MALGNFFDEFFGLFTAKNAASPLAPRPDEIKREGAWMVKNGLSEAILGFDPTNQGEELSQLDSLFKNNRWYLASNMRQLLSQLYVEHGLIQTIVDVPVDDGMRGGVTFKSKQISPDQLEELHAEFEQENLMSGVIGQSLKWNRLFGGAGILLITNQDPQSPFDVTQIKQGDPVDLRAVDLWELYYDHQNVDGFNPADENTLDDPSFDFYRYYGRKVHKSRVMMLRGLTAPSFIRPRLRGFGLSIVEAIVRSMNQFLKSNNLAYEVLDEFKIDIFGIKGLAQSMLDADGMAAVKRRVHLANAEKNYKHAITMDAEDTYTQKQLTFSGLADVLKEIRMQIASDLRMPLSKLFGISASGFNSGEDDIENYNGMVESQVRQKVKHHVIKIARIKCQQLFGMSPDDLQVEFQPLRVLSAEAQETVKTAKFNRLLAARTANLITYEAFQDGCNKESLLPVQIDSTEEELLAGELEQNEARAESAAALEPEKTEEAAPAAAAPASKTAAKDAPEAKT